MHAAERTLIALDCFSIGVLYAALGLLDPVLFATKQMEWNRGRAKELGEAQALHDLDRGTGRTTRIAVAAILEVAVRDDRHMVESVVRDHHPGQSSREYLRRMIVEFCRRIGRPDLIAAIRVETRLMEKD